MVVLVDAAGCHGQGACFWPLGGGGQKCCSTGCNTPDSPSPPCPPTLPPPTTRSDAAPNVRPAVLHRAPWSPARAAAPPGSAHQELRAPHQITQHRAGRSSPAPPPDSVASKSPVLTRAAVSTVAVQSPRQSEGRRLHAHPSSG